MALLFYCNYDNLQTRFSETFRILEQDHDDAKQEAINSKNTTINPWVLVKRRNGQFAHWTRLLREAVELYGTAMRAYPNIKLYHGM